MYPYQLQRMAVEHANDLRREANSASRVRRARSARVGARSVHAASRAGARLARRTAHS